jgi:hypothetical protein
MLYIIMFLLNISHFVFLNHDLYILVNHLEIIMS